MLCIAMTYFRRRAWLAFLCGVLVVMQAPARAEETILIAAGAGYKRPVEEIAQGFEALGKGRIERIYGHMGQVLAQARASGKVAVVFGEQDVLEKADQVKFSRFLALGMGRLVLAWPPGKSIKTVGDLAGDGFMRIGVADTRQAIFGKAAVESLQHDGLYARLEKRLLVVPTVPQVSAYLISGEVDAGFINLTEALAIREKIGGYIEMPAASYGPVHISAAFVAGQDSPSVHALLDYLQTPAVKDIFKRYGL